MLDKTDRIWFDGKLVPWDEATIHVLTHTLHYGLGVFEGIRCYGTAKGPAVFRLDEHVERLLKSAHIFLMEVPYSHKELCTAITETHRDD
jgi:branched-chain amino acid aminotransferase